MSSLPTLSGASALQQSLKPSEQTATLPGAADGGTGLSSGFAETLPQTTTERDILRQMEASVTSGATGVTGTSFSDSVRASRDAEKAAGASWFSGLPNLGSTDLGKKVAEGAEAMVAKFSDLNPFTKLAAGATSFFGLGGPKEIGKTGAGALSDAQRKALYDKPNGQASAKQTNAAQQANKEDQTHLVTLTDDEGFSVIFRVLPEIVENRSVEYEAVQPPQFPGAFQKYKGTASVQWSVNAIFVCRTTDEATENLKFLNRLRGWTMPYFGEFMSQTDAFKDKVGSPPPVLTFRGLRTNIIGPVPVVITSLNWNWPRDVDYIPANKLTDSSITESGVDLTGTINEDLNSPTVPFPAVISVAIQLVESFSVSEFNGFNLGAYRVGDMENAYNMQMDVTSEEDATISQTEVGQEAQLPSSPAGLTSPLQTIGPLASLPAFPKIPALPKIPPVPAALSEAKLIDDTSWRGRGLSGKRWTTKM
jgi:hypothetical protein